MQKSQNILNYVHCAQEKSGVSYLNPDSALTKFLYGANLILVIFTAIINIIFLIGGALHISGDTPAENELKNTLYTVALLTVLPFAAFVLQKRKSLIPSIIAAILNFFSCTVMFITFYIQLYNNDMVLGLTVKFALCHGVPIVLLAITSILLCIILIRYNILENRAYNKMVSSLYSTFSLDYETISDEQWQQFLDNYSPTHQKKLKRSLKAKLQKQQNKA